MRWRYAVWGLLALQMAAAPAGAVPPSVVFVLLDTTRADRFGAWGHHPSPTPTLDRLAERGIRFVRHFANAHATRPSMPQLMSGRYFHDNILAPFQLNAHPREMSFARPDPTAALLPDILRAAGYRTLAVSAHPWVSADCAFGHGFDEFALLTAPPAEGHAHAGPLVDRAIALWQARDRTRPALLYVHVMDMHMPRPLPAAGQPPALPPTERERFRPNGEPAFDRARRGWSRYDASDFTAADRAAYAAVYDSALRHTDGELARLLAAVEGDDPDLRNTVVVVTADHGEELGEDGRIEHPPSLADGVQHVPWIVAGGPVRAGQRCKDVTQHVDVVPTLLSLLGVRLPDGIVVDGMPRLGSDGVLTDAPRTTDAFYVWEEYRAVRRHHYVFVERQPANGPRALCEGPAVLYRLDGPHRERTSDPRGRRIAALRGRLGAQIVPLAQRYQSRRYAVPDAAFSVRTAYWQLEAPPQRCVVVGADTPRSDVVGPGWFWTGRGMALLDADGPFTARLRVPPGTYEVAAATNPIPRLPWLFGYGRWRRRAFQSEEPSTLIGLGRHATANEVLAVPLPAELVRHQHVLALRLTPPGAAAPMPGLDADQRERLRALGYVQ